jgi:cystathionine beta-lyase
MPSFDDLTLEALRSKSCMKWTHYEGDVLPLWVADMDFPPAGPITEALAERAKSGNLGYPAGYLTGEPGLRASLQTWLKERHGWRIAEEDIWPVHGIIPGLYLGVNACASASEGVVLQSPLYPPFINAVGDTGRTAQYNPLVWTETRWEMDFAGLEALITPETRVLMFCNPHNPTGRVFSRSELEALAEIVLRHRLWVVSDELHSDLVYPEQQHIPFASLSSEVAARTVTLMGPTKTFNIAGLKIGFVITQNAALRERLKRVGAGLVTPPNVMAQTAAKAAYTEGDAWLSGALEYLQGNRDRVTRFAEAYLPGGAYAAPEGTY